MTLLIKNAQIVLPARVTSPQGWVLVENGRFAAIGEGDAPDAAETIDAAGQYLFPGLVDLQINGGGGLNFNDAQNDADMKIMLEANLATGVTSLLATLIVDSADSLNKSLHVLASSKVTSGAEMLGIHLEGPFFNPQKNGMHAIKKIIPPDLDTIRQFLSSAQGKIKILTLAPEVPGALEAIAFLRQHNVIASMGHTLASYEDVERAEQAGATMATHLFNVMPTIHHRNPGMIPALLNSTLDIGVIADGTHIDLRVLKMVFKIAGPNYFLVSDAIAPLASDKTWFDYHGAKVHVKGGVCYNGEIMAGSVTPLLHGVINAHQHIGLALHEAVNLASLTPAKIIGMDGTIGSIEQGKQADFLLVEREFRLQRVYKNGQAFSKTFNL